MANFVGKNAGFYVAPGRDGSGNVIDISLIADIPADPNWLKLCHIDVNKSGSTETSDAGDSCNPDATIIANTTKEISVDVFVKKNSDGEIDEGVELLRKAFDEEDVVGVMSLDALKNNTAAAGDWMIANVSQFDESQPLRDTIRYSFTLVPAGSVTVPNRGRIELDLNA